MSSPAPVATPSAQPAAAPTEAQESFAEIFPTVYATEYILAVMKRMGMPAAMIKGKLTEAVKSMASENNVYLAKMHGVSGQYMQTANAENRSMRVNVGVKKIPGLAAPVNPNAPKPGVGI